MRLRSTMQTTKMRVRVCVSCSVFVHGILRSAAIVGAYCHPGRVEDKLHVDSAPETCFCFRVNCAIHGVGVCTYCILYALLYMIKSRCVCLLVFCDNTESDARIHRTIRPLDQIGRTLSDYPTHTQCSRPVHHGSDLLGYQKTDYNINRNYSNASSCVLCVSILQKFHSTLVIAYKYVLHANVCDLWIVRKLHQPRTHQTHRASASAIVSSMWTLSTVRAS